MIDPMQEPGLDLLISALERLRDEKERTPCASRAALERLLETQPASAPLATPSAVQSGSKLERLAPIRERVRVCTKCPHLPAHEHKRFSESAIPTQTSCLSEKH